MDVDVKRGYEVLPNNNVIFGVRITNNTDSVISDVQVILDYNESLFKLQGDKVQKLDSIPPSVPRTTKFILKPLGCVHKENIESTITYRDHKWEKHIVTMRPKEVHCVCPFLHPKPVTKNEFMQLSSNGHSIETGITFQGIEPNELIAFLMQTCATRLYAVDSHFIGLDRVLYFSGESIGEKNCYLLTALIKENTDTTQIMLRAVSDKTHGINGFLNEIVLELKHLVNTVNSAKEIGVIKHEHVINIIDSVVQRSNITNGNDTASINIKDSLVQRTELNTQVPNSTNDGNASTLNLSETQNDISIMYSANLEEIKEKHAEARKKKTEWDGSDPKNQLKIRQRAYDESTSLYSALRIDENTVQKRRFSKKIPKALIFIVLIFSIYMWAIPLIEMDVNDGNIIPIVDSYIVGSRVNNFLNSVNDGDMESAFGMYQGIDFLAPASIKMIFRDKGIEQGNIRDITIVSKTIVEEEAIVQANCNVSNLNIMGNEKDAFTIPIYFRLVDTGKGWIITRVSFYAPLIIESYDTVSTNSNSHGDTTGKLAVQTVSSNLMVKNIEGVRAKNSYSDMSDTIDLLKLKVGLNVASAPVDMNNVLISITDGKNTNILVYAGNKQSGQTMSGFSTSSAVVNNRQLLIGSNNPEKYYTVEQIRDEDTSFTLENPIMNTGDLITLYIATTSSSSIGYSTVGRLSTPNLMPSGLKLTPRTVVNIILTPESGAATTADFVTPSAYGVKETVSLYP